MARTIAVPVNNRFLSQIFENAQREAQRFGIIFAGDEYHGRFTNNRDLEGNYQVIGGEVVITVTKKPLLTPWSAVDKRIREFLL